MSNYKMKIWETYKKQSSIHVNECDYRQFERKKGQ